MNWNSLLISWAQCIPHAAGFPALHITCDRVFASLSEPGPDATFLSAIASLWDRHEMPTWHDCSTPQSRIVDDGARRFLLSGAVEPGERTHRGLAARLP